MMKKRQFVAVDIGATTGRVNLCRLWNGELEFEEVHRFETRNTTILGTRQWDAAYIYAELLAGLSKSVRECGAHIDSVGIATWGVDFALLSRDGGLIGNPVHYRDRRTENTPELTFGVIPEEELYSLTGIGYNRFNTIFQLHALCRSGSPQLEVAESFLMMGDLFHYFISGKQSCEYTNASTTQLLDPRTGAWHDEVIARMGFPRHLFKDLTPPGTVLGPILPDIAKETGLDPSTQVITPATHDTASAFAAVPVTDDSQPWACISCGTWSIMGTELKKPLITHETFGLGFSNEGGAEGRICFHKTFVGLWLVQECRRLLNQEGALLDYDELTALAAAAEPLVSVVDVEDPRLYSPDDMPRTLRAICRETNQRVPDSTGALIRCALESVALKYRQTLGAMDSVLGRNTRRIHLVGGGVQNELFCQLTADACGVPVWAGPVETTVLGNFAVQAKTIGAIDSLEEARAAIARSSEIRCYEPRQTRLWDKAAARAGSAHARSAC